MSSRSFWSRDLVFLSFNRSTEGDVQGRGGSQGASGTSNMSGLPVLLVLRARPGRLRCSFRVSDPKGAEDEGEMSVRVCDRDLTGATPGSSGEWN